MTGGIDGLSGTMDEMYAVYLEIAERDYACRIQALYGKAGSRTGHNLFRPLSSLEFAERYSSARLTPESDREFRQQLARQAAAYGVVPRRASDPSVPGRQAA